MSPIGAFFFFLEGYQKAQKRNFGVLVMSYDLWRHYGVKMTSVLFQQLHNIIIQQITSPNKSLNLNREILSKLWLKSLKIVSTLLLWWRHCGELGIMKHDFFFFFSFTAKCEIRNFVPSVKISFKSINYNGSYSKKCVGELFLPSPLLPQSE